MPDFDIAHLREQGVDLIIIPLDRSFEYKTSREQIAIRMSLQICAHSAGLAGTIVPVWDGGFGRLHFLAPPRCGRSPQG